MSEEERKRLYAEMLRLSAENVALRDQVVKHKASNEALTEHIHTLRDMLERAHS